MKLKIALDELILRDPKGPFIALPTIPEFDLDVTDVAALADLVKYVYLPGGKKIRIAIGEAARRASTAAAKARRSELWTQVEYWDSSKGDPIAVEMDEPSASIKWEVGGCIKVSGGS